jgi:hypothetical protein
VARLLLDPGERRRDVGRVDYDLKSATGAIRTTDLPHEFADDIETGGAARPAVAQ